MVITRIRPLSVAKVAGLLYGLIGMVIGGCLSLVAMAGGLAAGLGDADSGGLGAVAGMVLGLGAVVVLPVIYGVFGFIGTAISALIYNFAAGLVGGVEIDVQ